jgi:hypothetical protein
MKKANNDTYVAAEFSKKNPNHHSFSPNGKLSCINLSSFYNKLVPPTPTEKKLQHVCLYLVIKYCKKLHSQIALFSN